MEVALVNLQKSRTLRTNRLLQAIQSILKVLKCPQSKLTVVFVSNAQIKSLNRRYLFKTYATDVLAFDLNPKYLPLKTLKAVRGRPLDLHGEVIVSVEMALKQSKEFKTSASEELLLYIVHGILHLCGFDDHKPKDIQKMRAKEKEVLAKLSSQRLHPLIGS